MAITLNISDGTTTTVLSGTSPVLGCTYFPASPTMKDGKWENVTETAEVNLRGAASTIRATVNSIEQLLQQAIARQKEKAGARVYANFSPLSETTYRSEILDGRVVWSTEPGLRRLGDTNPTIRIAVIWTRVPYWEGAEVELQISALGQSADTGGRTVYNDPGNGNWVQIAAAQLAGDMPAPIRIHLANSNGGSRVYRKLFLSVNANSDPANFVHLLQGEARTSGGTNTTDATCSGGHRLDFNISSTPTVFTWTLPLADMARTKGRWGRIIARFAATIGPVYVTPTIRDYSYGGIVWTGNEVPLGSLVYESWQDLGCVPLPPGGYSTVHGACLLGLSFRGTAPATELDVIQIATLDSYRYLEITPAVTVASTYALVHDGIDGSAYVYGGALRLALPVTYGDALELMPNMINRIYILAQIAAGGGSGAGDVPIGHTFDVRVYHRPRRLTV